MLHDQLCPETTDQYPFVYCQCGLIARVRADERKAMRSEGWVPPGDLSLIVEREAARASDAERERIAQAIEFERNAHWQHHLREHPQSDGKSCPRDYGMHDAYYRAATIARAGRTP